MQQADPRSAQVRGPFQSHKTPTSAAAAWICRGAAVIGMMGVPLGPFGFLAGLILGGLGALCLGFLRDALLVKSLRTEVTANIKHLDHLIRWTEFVFSESEHPALMLIYLSRECQCITTNPKSKTTNMILERLEDLLRREDVQQVATDYLATFCQGWKQTGPEDVESFRAVIEVCTTAFENKKRVPLVYTQMAGLRSSPAIQSLLMSVTSTRKKDEQWVLFADDISNTTVDHIFRNTFHMRYRKDRRLAQTSSQVFARRLEESTALIGARRNPNEAPIPWINELAITAPSIPDGIAIDESYDGSESRTEVAGTETAPAAHQDDVSSETVIDVDKRVLRRRTMSLTGDALQPNVVRIENPSKGLIKRSTSTLASGKIPKEDLSVRREQTAVPEDKHQVQHANIDDSNDDTKVEQTSLVSATSGREVQAITSDARDSVPPTKVGRQSELPASLNVMVSGHHPLSGVSPGAKMSSISPSAVVPGEKRFFKNFEDFKDFDTNLKHKIPIGLTEFELLDEFLPEHPLGEWQVAVEKNDTRVYKQIVTVGGSDLVMVKGYCTFGNGVTIESMIYNLRDLRRRREWDKTFEDFCLVEANIYENEITYNALRAPWPASDREFLQWRRMINKLDDGTSTSSPNCAHDGKLIVESRILHRSADHPKYPEPTSNKIIRAESVISSYVFRKLPNNPNVHIMLLTQTDIKGIVPRWLVNSQAAKAPLQWIENFRKACLDSIVKFGRDPRNLPKYEPTPQYTNAVDVDMRMMASR